LLDEIEKAHPEAFNMLLQIMEDGGLSDAKGRKVDFRNTIIIMTSNVGADVINRDVSLGFTVRNDEAKTAAREYGLMKDKVLQELKKSFRPEFLNRLDAVIVFHSLTTAHIRQITDLMLKRVRTQLAEQNIKLEVTDEAMELLSTRGYDHSFGARPLRRIIQNLIEDPLAEGLLEQRFQPETSVYVAVEDQLLKLSSQAEYEEANAPTRKSDSSKSRKKAKDDDREPELSGASAGPSTETEK
jgi:ATP-dependent Clp protease ATP-binding subunit ClpC